MEYFTFPTELEKFNNVFNKEDLDALLKSELKLFSQKYHTFNISYKIRTLKKGKYLTGRCRKCTANLNFVQDEATNRYLLTKANCIHNHVFIDKPNFKEIKQYMSKIHTNDLSTFRQIITNRFQISDSTFYKAKRAVQFGDKFNFPQLVHSLLAEDISLKYNPFPLPAIADLPSTFIVITPQMKRLYREFGKCLYIDFTHSCIRDISNNQQGQAKKYILGILTGLSSAHKTVVFAYCLVLSESTENIYAFLRFFFDNQMQNITETIISGGGIGINSAIKRLEQVGCFKGYHLRDCSHILKSVKLKHPEDRKKLLELSKSRTTEEYHEIYQTLIDKQQIQKVSFFCFSKIPATFVHFGSRSSACEKIKDFIKKIKCEPYCQVALKLIRIFTSVNARCMEAKLQGIPFEDILGIKQLKQCRERLPKPIFGQIMSEFSKSVPLKVYYDNSQPNAEEHVVKSSKFGQQYRVRMRDQKLTCSCGYSLKTGLICRHAICYLNSQNLPYFSYISEFYKRSYTFKLPAMQKLRKQKGKVKGKKAKLNKP